MGFLLHGVALLTLLFFYEILHLLFLIALLPFWFSNTPHARMIPLFCSFFAITLLFYSENFLLYFLACGLFFLTLLAEDYGAVALGVGFLLAILFYGLCYYYEAQIYSIELFFGIDGRFIYKDFELFVGLIFVYILLFLLLKTPIKRFEIPLIKVGV